MSAMVMMVCGLAAWSGVDAAQRVGPKGVAVVTSDRSETLPAALAPWVVPTVTSPSWSPAEHEVSGAYVPAEASYTHEHAGHGHHDGQCCGGDACDSCHEHRKCRCWRCCVRSTCDMVPHAWYYPQSHGYYYYFRPYSFTQVEIQRQFVTSIEGDPRNPYSDGLFERIYEEMGGGVEPSVPETE